MNIGSFFRTLSFILNQPLVQDQKLQTIMRFIKWQIIGYFGNEKIVYDWIDKGKFYFSPTQWGISGNIYTGLLEFEDMSFLLHYLKTDDLFVDVGANHGSYSILAGAVIGATVIAYEPIPQTFINLKANVELNEISNQTKCLTQAVGEREKEILFSNQNVSALNHALRDCEQIKNSVLVKMVTLDNSLGKEIPNLMKIDVEGYEYAVLMGGERILKKPELNAIIIEVSKLGERYGFNKSMILSLMRKHGFRPCRYDPYQREIALTDEIDSQLKNTIFIRDRDLINQKVASAPKFKVLGKEI
jgi:FkbM family methyltransferase